MQPLSSLDSTILRHVSAFIGHLQVFYFIFSLLKLLLVFTICHLLKFLLKFLVTIFQHRITPVSLFCCWLLDYPCPMLLCLYSANPHLYCFVFLSLTTSVMLCYCIPTHPFRCIRCSFTGARCFFYSTYGCYVCVEYIWRR
jgi:hypothetical protein